MAALRQVTSNAKEAVMAAALEGRSAQATLHARTQELARTLKTKQAQGYTVESQTDTTAVIVIKGRKRRFRSSVDSRQIVTVDELGNAKAQKIEVAGD
jgi:hypothetical protein